MKQIKRVASLYRVSTLGQVDKDDIPMQKDCCRSFIAEHEEWTLVKEVYEKGISGFKKSARDRDAIVELQTLALQKEFDILLVYMFDRLGRRDDETPFIVEWFVQNGIEVWSVKEGQRRFDTHVDKLLNYITFWQASGESIKTSIRTKTRMEQLTSEGLFTGGVPTYGYYLVHNGRTNKRNRKVYDLAIDSEAANVIRLIFHKYVHEGYGSQRISRYLAEQHITKPDGSSFPNTTLNRILKNRTYLGIIHNGNAESEIIPELQIIDQETFNAAQALMNARRTHHNTVPLNMSGKALMKGNIFCGHCKNRLTLATSGHKKVDRDGNIIRKTRLRYQCHYGVRHPYCCDGQTVYSVDKLDSIIEEITMHQLARIKVADGLKVVETAHHAHIESARALCARINTELADARQEFADYQNEILRVIRGNSAFTQEMLLPLLEQSQSRIDKLTSELEQTKEDLQKWESNSDIELQEYTQLRTWADIYKTCSFDEKKMFLSRFIKRMYVYRGYKLEIEFNVSFEDFQKLTTDTISAS